MYLLHILLAIYLAAINVYSFMLVRTLKKREETRETDKKSGNAKLFVAGFLGGALAGYVALFVLKYRTDNLLLMLVLPLLAALNIYILIALLRSGMLVIG